MKEEIELIINDLEFTRKSSVSVARHYQEALQERPEQTQWLKTIGRAEGRSQLALEIIRKLNELIEE